jgi:hypothetical protein
MAKQEEKLQKLHKLQQALQNHSYLGRQVGTCTYSAFADIIRQHEQRERNTISMNDEIQSNARFDI